jgi:hypothetical protein
MSSHDDPAVLEALDLAWDQDEGFLGRLRGGRFSEPEGRAYLRLLESVEIGEGERLHPDFVRLVWFVPIFIEWNSGLAVERGADKLLVQKISDAIRERLMVLLGTP